jgi:glycerol kinase
VMRETTALGAAYAAGLAAGFYKNLDDLRENWAVDQTWKPNLAATRREDMYHLWKKAVTRSFDWVE